MKNIKNRHFFSFLYFLVFAALNAAAQIPAGYYSTANGKTGYQLKTALYDIIKGHNTHSYNDLWDLYKTSDKKSNGKVWDMYSDVPGGTPAYEYSFGSDQCGNYSGEGSCYNREHSFPKSWFNDASPMVSDPFHIVPTDGYVNGKRSNYAYGEVGSASWTSTNGSKLGTNSLAGYSGTVFEPIDDYKGDLARGYFYMATRYENLIDGWEKNNTNGDAMLDGSSDHVFEDWALEMLIKWHNEDPVSQKEIDRNNAIYNYQGNRNPFIDHPEYVGIIWGSSTSPTLTITASLTDFGTVNVGEASAHQQYTVAGANLTGAITIAASSGFEVSLTPNDADFSSSTSLNPNTGTVPTTTVYVRFKPTTDSNAPVNGTITHSTPGVANQVLNVAGSEKDASTTSLNITASLTDFGTVNVGEASAHQQYTVAGANLTGAITIAASSGFEVSLTPNDADFNSSTSLTPNAGTVPTTTVYVRFKPTTDSNAPVNGTITHSTPGVANQVLNVTGTEYAKNVPELNFNFSYRSTFPVDTFDVQLFADIAPNSDLSLHLVQLEALELQYGSEYSTVPATTNDTLSLTWLAGATSALFKVHFNTDAVSQTAAGRLTYQLVPQEENYTLGTNNTFILELKGNDVISGLTKNDKATINLYPNPAHAQVTLNGPQHTYHIQITNMVGQVVLQQKNTGKTTLDVSHLKAGQYIVQLSSSKANYTHILAIY